MRIRNYDVEEAIAHAVLEATTLCKSLYTTQTAVMGMAPSAL